MSGLASPKTRNLAPVIALVVIMVLVLYYAIISVTGVLRGSADVDVKGAVKPTTADYLTLRLEVEEIDPTNRTMQATIQPIPRGSYASEAPGEIAKSLRVVIDSGGTTTHVVAYPGQSIVDPTALSIRFDRGDSAYPFDVPSAKFRVSVRDEDDAKDVPFDLNITSSARPWVLAASMDGEKDQNDGASHTVTIDGKRDFLSIALVLFYVLAIFITTLIAVVTIGVAILGKTLAFSNVIWLSATMISFPTLRSAMPGAPPIGTSMDFIIFFPCMALVAALLVWTGAYLLWRDSRALRTFDREAAGAPQEELDSIA